MNHRPRPRSRYWAAFGVLGLLLALIAPQGGRPAVPAQASNGAPDIAAAFAAAARESGAPEPLLLALGYALSRWEQHPGKPSTTGGFGIMHLTDADWRPPVNARGDDRARPAGGPFASLQTLAAAARLLGMPPESLASDAGLNIRGGAALLASYARQADGALPATLEGWYGAVARYSGFADSTNAFAFADLVYDTLRRGASRTTSAGQHVTLRPQAVSPIQPDAAELGFPTAPTFEGDCPPALSCEVVPAAYALTNGEDYGNYDLANRPVEGQDIRYIIIHDTEISYDLTLQVFQNPLTIASSHYVTRSSDGHTAQMVENRHITWHAGNWYINSLGIGLEHEGVAIEGASWYTEYLYHASARLTRYLTDKYGIPRDRAHIIGHDEVPGPVPGNQAGMHWDPGPFWDWDHYMDLVRGDEPERMAPTAG
ncbi:MAG TPA: N-acetylmuramoyl-L-alanine amidase, partial [Herpetosiphonaceae bacterium]|nr:N-acetylmuramoyl-L-alanine amidase [Herpetosiphonaceae bacterium]